MQQQYEQLETQRKTKHNNITSSRNRTNKRIKQKNKNVQNILLDIVQRFIKCTIKFIRCTSLLGEFLTWSSQLLQQQQHMHQVNYFNGKTAIQKSKTEISGSKSWIIRNNMAVVGYVEKIKGCEEHTVDRR